MKNLKYPIGRFDQSKAEWNIERKGNIEYIKHYPQLLKEAIKKLSHDQMQTPYRPDGWTITQLIHHIADSHMNAYIRFKLSLTETKPTIKPYNEGQWAELPDYHLETIEITLELLTALHYKWAYLMKSMQPKDWAKEYYHPQDQVVVQLEEARKLYYWHSAHHLAHITSLKIRKEW